MFYALITGYRNRLNFLDCMRSLFLLHNETINIWSHLLGFAFFAGLFVHDLVLVIPAVTDDGKTVITKTDFLVLMILLICYQVLLSRSVLDIVNVHRDKTVCEATISTILDDIILFIGYNGAFVIVPYL